MSFAKWEPVKIIDDGPRDTKWNAIVFHTAVTTTKDEYAFLFGGGEPKGVGFHLYIAEDGSLDQYLDTDRSTGHAWDANGWSIGCETWDDGDPEHTAWNQAQLDTMDRLCRELKIPAIGLKEGPSNGVGYHQEYASWNQSNHNCPGSLRRAQIPGIIARLAKPISTPTPQEDDVALTKDECTAVAFQWGARQRFGGQPRPADKSYTGSDGKDHSGAAQDGWDWMDGKQPKPVTT